MLRIIMCALIVSMGIKHYIKLELHKSIFLATSVTKTLGHNKEQEKHDIMMDQLSVTEYEDPFKG